MLMQSDFLALTEAHTGSELSGNFSNPAGKTWISLHKRRKLVPAQMLLSFKR